MVRWEMLWVNLFGQLRYGVVLQRQRTEIRLEVLRRKPRPSLQHSTRLWQP